MTITLQPELRAFPIFATVPDGCRAHLMPNDMHWPHLRVGEWAVVDPAQTAIEVGELYLVQQIRRQAVWQLNRFPAHRPEEEDWLVLSPCNRPRSLAECDEWMRDPRRRIYLSDGPIAQANLQPMLIGKVVGIWQAAAPGALIEVRPAGTNRHPANDEGDNNR